MAGKNKLISAFYNIFYDGIIRHADNENDGSRFCFVAPNIHKMPISAFLWN